MTQRIYWVPHTKCFLGCAHCHNDSGPGQPASRALIEAIIAHLKQHGCEPGPIESRYGAKGQGPSIYVADPEGNMVELKGPPWEG